MFGFLKSDKGQTLSSAYPELQISNAGYQTNNQYSNFPPLMHDGRSVMASWQPETVINDDLLKSEGIQSNWQYRQFMTSNSQNIREKMFHDALNDVGIMPNQYANREGMSFTSPKLYSSPHEPISHLQAMPSDLKETYFTREQLQNKLIVPSLTQEQMVRQWQATKNM
jgi:hypothetical protein